MTNTASIAPPAAGTAADVANAARIVIAGAAVSFPNAANAAASPVAANVTNDATATDASATPAAAGGATAGGAAAPATLPISGDVPGSGRPAAASVAAAVLISDAGARSICTATLLYRRACLQPL
ncbi:RNA-binding protein 24-like [Procambarus clarkii]|uniref:RNA-binding protein 24-like n=1 Tax=Procambarus clarkii TaxID=6728 RepID=UPI0037442139